MVFMKKRAGSIGFILVFSVVFLVMGNTIDFSEPGDVEAYYATQNFIEKITKVPGTARFPLLGEQEVNVDNISNDEWEIKGYVESKSFDDVVQRYHYKCKTKYETDDNNWKLLNIEFSQ